MPKTVDKYTRSVVCAGGCGATEQIVEPPPSRPLLRTTAAIVQSFNMLTKGWEWENGQWWCKPCRVRRRLLKSV